MLGKKHLVIPDTQVKPGVSLEHFEWIGKYIVEKKPDVIVHIGDLADMPSLCSYDVGKKCFEGRRYKQDIKAALEAQELLFKPLREYNDNQRKNHKERYKPRFVLLIGNHEERINKVIDSEPRLDGTISIDDLKYKEFGWEVHPFLERVTIDGITYSHYFTSGVMGRPVASAAALLREECRSCTMGHVQHTDIAIHKKHGFTALFCGTCYLHDEDYLGNQGNGQRRQIILKHGVHDGRYDICFVSLDFLKEKYVGTV